MPKLIVTNGIGAEAITLRCSDCEEVFTPQPVPRGARPWTPEEAGAKLASQFKEHVEKVHREVNPDA